MGNKLRPRVLIFLLSLASARAQDCSNIFRVYRGFDGLHAEVIKSNNYLESVLRLEVIMSVATSLNGVNLFKFFFYDNLILFLEFTRKNNFDES